METTFKDSIIDFINHNREVRISGSNYSNEQLALFILSIYRDKKRKFDARKIYNMIGYLYMEEYAQDDPIELAQERNDELWAVGME